MFYLIDIFSIKMAGRPSQNLEQYQEEILSLWTNNASVQDILNHLTIRGVQTSRSTLHRRLTTWGISRRDNKVSDEVVELVRLYFFRYGYNDQSIQRDLGRQGISLTVRSIKDLRLQHRIKQRYCTDEERQEALEAAQQFLQ
jgi:hypothetical protein